MRKHRVSVLSAAVLAVALFAATAAVAHADEYFVGRVAALSYFPGQGYFVEISGAGPRETIQVSEELWNQLDIGDTMSQTGDTWSLLHKGPSEGAIGAGERTR
jgi:hypothetical protein